MSSFKGKATKVKYLTQTQTLDEIHRKYITDYVSINSGDDWRKNLEKSGSALINAIELINS